MTEVEAWPFIVARNATLDWRPILAPSFLVDVGADYLLVTETSDPGAEPSRPNVSVVESARAGTITLAFRTVPATSALLGRTPVEPLLDRFGRPLHVIEGLAIRGAHEVLAGDLRTAIDRVRAETLRLMPAFWEEQSESAPAVESQPLRVGDSGQAMTVGSQDEASGRRSGSWPALPFAIIVFAAVGTVAWWWFRAT